MSYMFYVAHSFNHELCWDVGSKNTDGMFQNDGSGKIGCPPPTASPTTAPSLSSLPSSSPSLVLSDSTGMPDVVTSREVDGSLYRSEAGGLAFNVTTVRMESEFNEINAQNEIQMVYDYYAPSDRENTTYDLRLYNKDCVTHGADSNVGSKYITVSQADPLAKRNNWLIDGTNRDISEKTEDEQVHLAGNGWGAQVMLDIPLDIHQDEIFNSPYFQYTPDTHYTEATIEFCARFVMFYDIDNDSKFNIHAMDPYKEVEAVQFHETLVKLTFNLTQDFQISDISLEKDAVIKRSDQQRLKYQLDAFHCEPSSTVFNNEDGTTTLAYDTSNTYPAGYQVSNDTYGATTTRKITQSTILYICLKLTGNSANIGIREIAQLEFIQPKSQITSFAIYKRTPNAITTESHYGEQKRKMLVVSTRLVLPFFDNRDPKYTNTDAAASKLLGDYDDASASNVIAKGSAIMMFQNDKNNIRHLLGFNRGLQETGEEAEEAFEVELGLGYDDESSACAVMSVIAMSFASISSIVSMM